MAMARIICRLSLLALLCTSLSAQADERDKFEVFNRATYAMNSQLDAAILKPVTKTYRYVVPKPVRTGVNNFFSNLYEIPTIINDLLQANFLQAYNDTWRFALNSTFGLGGVVDVATYMGLQPHTTDFGLTLALWGCRDSSYLVLPLLGPSTIRDGIAIPIQYYGMSILPYITPWQLRFSVLGLDAINLRSSFLDFDSIISLASFDPYVFQRDAYMQHRHFLIQKTLAQKPYTVDDGSTDVASTSNDTTDDLATNTTAKK